MKLRPPTAAVMLWDRVERQAAAQIARYQLYKKMTRQQHSAYAEDTDRYGMSIRWFGIIRQTIAEWSAYAPRDTEAVCECLGIGNRVTPSTPQSVALKYHISLSTLYQYRSKFVREVAYRAIAMKLIEV